MPVVAVTTGALLADEAITAEIIGGGALVLAGVYVGALASRSRRTEPAVEAA
jgi:drug/metabolite transporter (DMT)-like permease